MDGYFVVAPTPVTIHAPSAPIGVPWGNGYQVNQSLVSNFWSVRDLWSEERWPPQSEVTIAASMAQVIPVYIPYESPQTQVVMISW